MRRIGSKYLLPIALTTLMATACRGGLTESRKSGAKLTYSFQVLESEDGARATLLDVWKKRLSLIEAPDFFATDDVLLALRETPDGVFADATITVDLPGVCSKASTVSLRQTLDLALAELGPLRAYRARPDKMEVIKAFLLNHPKVKAISAEPQAPGTLRVQTDASQADIMGSFLERDNATTDGLADIRIWLTPDAALPGVPSAEPGEVFYVVTDREPYLTGSEIETFDVKAIAPGVGGPDVPNTTNVHVTFKSSALDKIKKLIAGGQSQQMYLALNNFDLIHFWTMSTASQDLSVAYIGSILGGWGYGAPQEAMRAIALGGELPVYLMREAHDMECLP